MDLSLGRGIARIRWSHLAAIVVLVSTAVAGLLVARTPKLAYIVLLCEGFVALSIWILTSSERVCWYMLLGTVFVAAFGAFLDIILHMPFMWLLSLFVIYFFALLQIRGSLFPVGATSIKKSLPLIGTALLCYAIYYFLQSIRVGINGLLGFRKPFTNLAFYLITFQLLLRADRDELRDRLRDFALVILVAGIFVASYAIFQYVVGEQFLRSRGLVEAASSHQGWYGKGMMAFRPYGTMRRAEGLGSFLYLDIVMAMILLGLGYRRRRLVWFNLILVAPALILSMSLVSIVTTGLFFLLTVPVGFSELRKYAVPLFLILLVAAIGVNYISGNMLLGRFMWHLERAQEGEGRLELTMNWGREIMVRSIPQNLLGSGICTGIDDATLIRIRGVLDALGIPVGPLFACSWQFEVHDNLYAVTYLEIGFIGFILLLLPMLLAFPIRQHLRYLRPVSAREAYRSLANFVIAAIPAGLVAGLLGPMPVCMYFWILMAFLDTGGMAARSSAASSFRTA